MLSTLNPVVAADNDDMWIAASRQSGWVCLTLVICSLVPGCYSGGSQKTYPIKVSLWANIPQEVQDRVPGAKLSPPLFAVCLNWTSDEKTDYRLYPIQGEIEGTKASGYKVVSETSTERRTVFRILGYDVQEPEKLHGVLKGDSEVEWLLDVGPNDVVSFLNGSGKIQFQHIGDTDPILPPGEFWITIERKRQPMGATKPE